MADSKVVTLILTQVFIILGVTIAGLTVYVFYLKHKIENGSVAAPQEAELETSPANHSQENDIHASDARGNDAWKLETFFNEEIQSNERIYQSLSGSKIPQEIDTVDEGTDAKLLAILIRHLYLKAELEALVHRKDPEPFWALLSPPLIGLASLLLSEETKTSLVNLEEKNRELLNFQEVFFSLQKLIREQLPTSHVAKLLPLTEEMSILQSDAKPEDIPKHYEECFKGISELFNEKLSPTSGAHTEEKAALEEMPDIQNTQILEIEGFINVLQDQGIIPIEQMGEYNNFLLRLKDQFKKNEASFLHLKQTLVESEMCSQFLESELAAAQETVKTLIENVEENGPNDQLTESEQKVKDLEELVDRFTNESRDMLMSIQMLQDENAELRNKIDNPAA